MLVNAVRSCLTAGRRLARGRALSTSTPGRQVSSPFKDYGFTQHSKQLESVEASKRSSAPVIDGKNMELLFLIDDKPGGLTEVLQLFSKHGVNLSRIESRPSKTKSKHVEFMVDFEGKAEDPKVTGLLASLQASARGVQMVAPKVVPWFPTHISDIDNFSTKTLDAGTELESDHPGFSDEEYRERRRLIVATAAQYKYGQEIPRVQYTAREIETWGLVYEKLGAFTRQFAVDSYNHVLPLLENFCGYRPNNIPQLQDISDFLKTQTGFTLRPVGGLLSARDFLNGLAFRVFFSTQYIRHHTRPLYTPEPDICHELMGHAPMFADPDFADFSHEIGLASLGASDEEIKRLATCYWYSVEFGLCKQEGQLKAYGAGLLSSFGELEYACADYRPAGGEASYPEYRPWDPWKAAVQSYPITKYQPLYYVADSLRDAKDKMRGFCESMNRGFHTTYDPETQSVSVDRAIVRGQYTVTLQT